MALRNEYETYEQAERAALKFAKKSGECRYIIRDYGDYEPDSYHVTDEEGLNTFFCGDEPVSAVSPAGWID